MRYVKPIKEYCIGCHLCELACLTEHSKSGDLILAYTKERLEDGLKACKRVHHRGPVAVAMSCRHCAEPMCVTACISGALYKDPESGRTEYDREKCVGCWACVMACPFGSIQRHEASGKIIKCDLCSEHEIPACVAACPNQALVLIED